jgi:pilus assembly protein CpaF
MVRTFNPYEYIGRLDVELDENVTLPAADCLYDVLGKVREYLRDEHANSFAQSIIDPFVREAMKTVIADYLTERRNLHIRGVELESLIKTIQQEILYFGPIQKALDDPTVTNIDINTPRDVYIERDGEEEYRPDLGFKDEEHLYNVINKMLIPHGKTLTANEPHVDSLFENYRICAVLKADRGGIATESTCVSIRKFAEDSLSPEQLVAYGTISRELDQFFRDAIPCSNIWFSLAAAASFVKTSPR